MGNTGVPFGGVALGAMRGQTMRMAGETRTQSELEPLFRCLLARSSAQVLPAPDTLLNDLLEASPGLLALGYLPMGGQTWRTPGCGRQTNGLLGEAAWARPGCGGRPPARISGSWRVQPAMGEDGQIPQGHLILRSRSEGALEDIGWEELADGIGALVARTGSRHQSEHLLALGARSASLAHDLRNRLTGIMLEACRMRLDDRAVDFGQLEDHLMEAAELCGRVLDSEGPGPSAPLGTCPAASRLDLCQVAASALERARSTSRAGSAELPAEVINDLPAGGQVFANRTLLEDALVNLIVNAAEAAGSRGSVQVGLTKARGLCGFWVQDDGRGLPAGATEPGASNGGSGHGLSGVIECARRHGGELIYSRREGFTRLELACLDADHLEGSWRIHFDPLAGRLARNAANHDALALCTQRLDYAIRWMELLIPEVAGEVHAWRGTPGLGRLVRLVGGWGSQHVNLVVHSGAH